MRSGRSSKWRVWERTRVKRGRSAVPVESVAMLEERREREEEREVTAEGREEVAMVGDWSVGGVELGDRARMLRALRTLCTSKTLSAVSCELARC